MAKILIVDDEQNIVDILSEFLTKKGFQTIKCYNGKEAIEAINRGIPVDLIVLDHRMPGMDGAVVLKELGNLRKTGWRIRAAEYMLPPAEREFLEGVSKLRSGLYQEAMNILENIVSANSEHHLAWFYLGRCSNLTGSLQEAEEYLRNAVSRNEDNPDYLVELAVVLEKLKRHSEAETFYKKSALIRKTLAAGK